LNSVQMSPAPLSGALPIDSTLAFASSLEDRLTRDCSLGYCQLAKDLVSESLYLPSRSVAWFVNTEDVGQKVHGVLRIWYNWHVHEKLFISCRTTSDDSGVSATSYGIRL